MRVVKIIHLLPNPIVKIRRLYNTNNIMYLFASSPTFGVQIMRLCVGNNRKIIMYSSGSNMIDVMLEEVEAHLVPFLQLLCLPLLPL